MYKRKQSWGKTLFISFRVGQYLLCSPILSDHWVQLVPAVTNGPHLSARGYFLLPLNQEKVEHRSG